jgi:hypothetical protein
VPVITPPVDAGLAAWLKADALFVVPTDTTIAARWGDRAIDTALVSTIAFQAAAIEEGLRELRLLGGPLVRDEHVVTGLRHDLIGRRIRLRTYAAQDLGYGEAGTLALVVGATESEASDTTTLTVIRRLA